MNGFITQEQYAKSTEDTFDKVIKLIEYELTHWPQTQPTTPPSQPSHVTAPAIKVEAGGATVSIEAGKVESKVEGKKQTTDKSSDNEQRQKK